MPQAIFVGTHDSPPTLLLASSADSGVDAGSILKPVLEAHGGSGGGSPRIGQGTVADGDALQRAVQALVSSLTSSLHLTPLITTRHPSGEIGAMGRCYRSVAPHRIATGCSAIPFNRPSARKRARGAVPEPPRVVTDRHREAPIHLVSGVQSVESEYDHVCEIRIRELDAPPGCRRHGIRHGVPTAVRLDHKLQEMAVIAQRDSLLGEVTANGKLLGEIQDELAKSSTQARRRDARVSRP